MLCCIDDISILPTSGIHSKYVFNVEGSWLMGPTEVDLHYRCSCWVSVYEYNIHMRNYIREWMIRRTIERVDTFSSKRELFLLCLKREGYSNRFFCFQKTTGMNGQWRIRLMHCNINKMRYAKKTVVGEIQAWSTLTVLYSRCHSVTFTSRVAADYSLGHWEKGRHWLVTPEEKQ